jgi:FlaA1/EpsC-like NDP-sugar epimerase
MSDGSMEVHRPDRRARLSVALRRAFPALQFAGDAMAWVVAVPVATFLRYDLRFSPINPAGVAGTVCIAVVAQGAIGLAMGLYRRRYHYGSLDEVRVLGLCMASVGIVTFGFELAVGGGSLVPRSVPLLSAALALLIAAVLRYVARLIEDRHLRPSADQSEPLVVYGAGHTAAQITRTMLRTPESPLRPVALLDDDPRKARMQLYGLRVQGTGAAALRVANEHGARSVLVAIVHISGEQLQTFSAPLLEAGIRVLVLPPFAELLGDVAPSNIRPLTVADLLGRHPADVDPASIAGYVRGRRVLVTGAGGSIGSELCRQLRRFEPAALVMLDRDESGLHATQLTLEGRALLDSPSLVLADIRDRQRVFEVFERHRPEVVFHAAALKHLPLLEHNPDEAWKTNVVGTHHVLEAAQAVGVDRFVNVSTDKAADPICVLGFSKRICERLTAGVAERTGRAYVSVRFGNVLGSKGSVLGTFERQVRDGGPVTVTHTDVTRYFMTTEEAVALTIQAGALGEEGEVLVLDMGQPVRIVELAERLIAQSGTDIPIVYTGLRPGEKLHEVLIGDDEVDRRPNHRLISQIAVPALEYEDARAACSVDGRLVLSAMSLEIAAEWAAVGDPNGLSSSTMIVDDDGDT